MRLKRENAPKFWPLGRKKKAFAVKARPGPHPKDYCLPLLVIVRDILKVSEKGAEARKVIRSGHVKVDQVVRKDYKFPAGLFDVVTLGDDNYRVVPSQSGLRLLKIPASEAKAKLSKVVDKTTVKKGKIQLNLNDGVNLLYDKAIPTRSSVLVLLPERRISKELPMKEGHIAMVVRGKNSGLMGTVKRIVKVKGSQSDLVIIKTKDKEIEIPQEYVFIVGDNKPVLHVEVEA